MPDYKATAELHRLEMSTLQWGKKLNPGPRYLRSGTLVDFVRQVIEKRKRDALIYSITVPLEAGFGKEVLAYQDIEAISQRADFPRA
jgi:hypothetical protein